jgi:phytoene desaturase (3,4-didehydrolycopene-forming)
MVTAAKLAQSGYRVTLCEQNPSLGGRLQTVSMSGCRFDTGPSLLLLPQVYRDTFAYLGSSLEDHVQLARVEPAAYRVWFGDGYGAAGKDSPQGCTLDLLYDVQQMVQQLEQVEAGAGDHLDTLAWLAARQTVG